MTFPSPLPPLTLLKLGGSLITDKTRPHTPRLEVLARLAEEIACRPPAQPGLRLLLGHGSGSFGHVPAQKYGTRQGVHSRGRVAGFCGSVARGSRPQPPGDGCAAAGAGVPALCLSALRRGDRAGMGRLPPGISPRCSAALEAGLLPVIYGDVVFDRQPGGTILSTEDLFTHLVPRLRPARDPAGRAGSRRVGRFPRLHPPDPRDHARRTTRSSKPPWAAPTPPT